MLRQPTTAMAADAWASSPHCPHMVQWLQAHFCTRLTVADTGDGGRIYVEIGSPRRTTTRLASSGYADGLEVLSPPDVRTRMAELGALLVERHGA